MLFAPDPDAEAAFYQALFRYDVFSMPGRSHAQHLIPDTMSAPAITAQPAASTAAARFTAAVSTREGSTAAEAFTAADIRALQIAELR